MTLFDSIQNMVFGRKKSKDDIVENDVLGKVTPVVASIKSREGGQFQKVDADLNVEDLRGAISLQKEQVSKIKDSIKGYDKHFTDYEKSKKVMLENKRQLEKQKKDYLQIINRTDITAQQKEQFRAILKDIEKTLNEIKGNERKNDKFIGEIRYMIKESEKAIRVNEKAIEQNEMALKASAESKGNVKIQSKDIGELQRQVENEDLVSIPKQEALKSKVDLQVTVGDLNTQMQSVSQMPSAMKDDDYWEKGEIS